MAFLDIGSLFGGKKWYQSMTAWGLLAFTLGEGILTQICSVGLLSPATCATATPYIAGLGQILIVLGIRRAAAK